MAEVGSQEGAEGGAVVESKKFKDYFCLVEQDKVCLFIHFSLITISSKSNSNKNNKEKKLLIMNLRRTILFSNINIFFKKNLCFSASQSPSTSTTATSRSCPSLPVRPRAESGSSTPRTKAEDGSATQPARDNRDWRRESDPTRWK